MALQFKQMEAEKKQKQWEKPQKENVKFTFPPPVDEMPAMTARFLLRNWNNPYMDKELNLEKHDHVRITNNKNITVIGIVTAMPDGKFCSLRWLLS